MKRLIALFIILLIAPISSAEDIDVGINNPFITAHLENCTILNQERIPDGNFTTDSNYTFPYENARKITYEINGSVRDYMIVWECGLDSYLDEIVYFNDYLNFYSDNVSQPIRGVCYIELSSGGNYIDGIILDCENISYTEGQLVREILGHYDYGVKSDPEIEIPKAPVSLDSYDSHYHGPVIDKYDIVRNDPYSYYDYFDYEDDLAIDDYMYDNGYDE